MTAVPSKTASQRQLRVGEEQARRGGDLGKAAEILYGSIPATENS